MENDPKYGKRARTSAPVQIWYLEHPESNRSRRTTSKYMPHLINLARPKFFSAAFKIFEKFFPKISKIFEKIWILKFFGKNIEILTKKFSQILKVAEKKIIKLGMYLDVSRRDLSIGASFRSIRDSGAKIWSDLCSQNLL